MCLLIFFKALKNFNTEDFSSLASVIPRYGIGEKVLVNSGNVIDSSTFFCMFVTGTHEGDQNFYVNVEFGQFAEMILRVL